MLPGGDRNGAVARGEALDADGAYEGVRVMAITERGSRSPIETLAYISPHLRKTGCAPQGKGAMPVPSEALQNADDARTLPPSLTELPGGAQTRPTAVRRPETTGERIRYGKMVAPIGTGVVASAVSYVPLTALSKVLAGEMMLGAGAPKNIVVAGCLAIFLIVTGGLLGRLHRRGLLIAPAAVIGPSKAAPTARPAAAAVPKAASKPEPANPPATDLPPAPSSMVDGQALKEDHRREVLEFLAAALVAIKDDVPRMNQHVSFGINLFISGAAERYASESKLTRMQTFVLIREGIEALGNPPDRVDAFCRQIVDYKTTERYNAMIEAGRQTMERHLARQLDPFLDFAETIKLWSSDSAARAQTQGIVCIMFTDLVGSTAMTQERGDYGAQEVVRTHNAIVRSALADHAGREVKHTGDGIMASFPAAPSAVRATIDIQRALAQHNARTGAVPVRVRIGLNAGEAVQEEDDFFGTTVQLSARVCDKAGATEIFVTDNVRELTKGHGFALEDAGEFELKGIPRPVTLYRVDWTAPPPPNMQAEETAPAAG